MRVTKVRQVESEFLKKQFQDSQEEITQLKNTIKTQKEEIHNTQIEVKYLKKIVSFLTLLRWMGFSKMFDIHRFR